MSTALVKRASVRAEEARVLDAREQRNKARQELARNMSGALLFFYVLGDVLGSGIYALIGLEILTEGAITAALPALTGSPTSPGRNGTVIGSIGWIDPSGLNVILASTVCRW